MMLSFLVGDVGRAELERPARALGRAMQVTNILRDVGEDRARLGRVYLPADALACHGLCTSDLDGTALSERRAAYTSLTEELMGLAEGLYDEAEGGIGALPGPSRAGIRAAARMYREILNEVRAAGYDNLTRRAVVPLPTKLRAAALDGYGARRARLAPVGARP
jgi:phytoene synthase